MAGLITTISEDGKAPDCILWAPKGEHRIKASVNNEAQETSVNVTQEAVALLQSSLERKLADNVRPICYFDHEVGKASFIPTSFEWDEEKGIVMRGEWTKAGREAIEGRDYSYFSPTFGRNAQTGEIAGLLNGVEVGSLVNDPAFESIERIAASKKDNLANVLEVEDDKKEPHNTNCQDDKTKTNNNMTDEEIKSLQDKVALLEKENAELKEKKNPLEDELEAAKKEVDKIKTETAAKEESLAKDEVEEAVKAGKIAPQDEDTKEFWMNSLKVDAVRARRQLRNIAPNPALAEVVNAGTPPNKELTGRDRFKDQLSK